MVNSVMNFASLSEPGGHFVERNSGEDETEIDQLSEADYASSENQS